MGDMIVINIYVLIKILKSFAKKGKVVYTENELISIIKQIMAQIEGKNEQH